MKFHRRKFLIIPQIQLRLVGYLLIMLIVNNVFIYYNALGLFEERLNDVRALGEARAAGLDEAVNMSYPLLLKLFVECGGITILTFIVGGIFVSHRIVGPIFKIKNYLKDIRNNPTQIPPLKLRKHDFLQDFASDIESTLKSLKP